MWDRCGIWVREKIELKQIVGNSLCHINYVGRMWDSIHVWIILFLVMKINDKVQSEPASTKLWFYSWRPSCARWAANWSWIDINSIWLQIGTGLMLDWQSHYQYLCFQIEWIFCWIQYSQFQSFEYNFESNFTGTFCIEFCVELN